MLPLPLLLQPPVALAHGDPSDPGGYIQVTLDGEEVAQLTDVIADLAIEAGEHTLGVELYWPDGDAFYPPIEDEVTFTVE